MARIALFASGTATNARRLLEDDIRRNPTGRIVCTLSDRTTSGVHAAAAAAGIPGHRISYGNGRDQAEADITNILAGYRVDLLVLAGYMRILSADLVQSYESRILNIHPSLLPDFPGMHAIERSFEAGTTRAGITIHLVDAGVDTGPILVQASFASAETPTLEDFEKRIHSLEHSLYPEVVEQVGDYVDNGAWPGARLNIDRLRSVIPDYARLED